MSAHERAVFVCKVQLFLDYRDIVYFTCLIKFCYPNQLSKIFPFHCFHFRQFDELTLSWLLARFDILRVDIQIKKILVFTLPY